MKVIIEVNSSANFDYEYFIDWLNDELVEKKFRNLVDYTPDDINFEASIVSVDGEDKY